MTTYRKFNDYLIETLKNPEEARAFLALSIEEYEERCVQVLPGGL